MPPSPDASRWRGLGNRVLDLLYPPLCALCNVRLSDSRALCDACAAELPRLREPFCQACGEAFPGIIERPFACPNCQDLKFAFSFARPAMLRDPGTLDLIHRLKYGREVHLAGELGRLALVAFEDDLRLAPVLAARWPLVPVPLHRSRLRHRHFNQAGEISRALSRLTGMPVLHALKRTRSTSTQTLLSRRQRMENLRGAFATTRAGEKHLEADASGAVLVDDVLTTGSTVHECAQTLRRAGFNDVCVVTVMRG